MMQTHKAARWMVPFITAALVFTSAGCHVKVNTNVSSNSAGSTQNEISQSDSSMPEDNSGAGTTDSSSLADNTSGNVSENGGSVGSSALFSSTSSGSGKNSSAASNYKEAVYDLKGRVITIASENSVPDMTKNSIFVESIKLTEKKYNCKFKFIQKSDYVGLYTTLINDHAAGTATYDVVELRGYDVYPNAANSGAILQCEKYYDFENDPTWDEEMFNKVGVFKNHWYGICAVPNEMGNAIWYNRALLRKYNVPDLWSYVKNNTWNWNTFRAVCKKLTNDTNGDNKPDIWAFTSEDPWLAFISTNNASLLTTGLDGSPKISLDSPNALEALQFVSNMFLVDNTIPDGAELGAITNSPFNAMTTGKVAMFNYQGRYGAVLESFGIPSSDIGWIYMPKGPKATNYSTSTGTLPNMYVLPLAAKNPKEIVAAMQDLAAYWDTSRTVRRNVPDKTMELYNALKTSLDSNAKTVLLYQAQHPSFNFSNNYNVSEILQNKVWPSILNQTKSVKSAVSAYKSEMQTDLTNKYNGTKVS